MRAGNLDKTLKSSESCKLRFGGDSSIDAKLFANIIINMSDLVRASIEVINPKIDLGVEIKVSQRGNFENTLDLVACYELDLLDQSFSVVDRIVDVVASYMVIKKHLGGKRPSKFGGGKGITIIENYDGEELRVKSEISRAFFKDNRVDNLIIDVVNHIKKAGRSSFELELKGERYCLIKRGDYDNMIIPVVFEEDNIEEVKKYRPFRADLVLLKLDLLSNSKWEFKFGDKNISAKVYDKNFLRSMRNGEMETLHTGVRIPVMMQKEFNLDRDGKVIDGSVKYTVLRVVGNILEPSIKSDQYNLL